MTRGAFRTDRRALLPSGSLLRIATAGSVDDGKSTLIGRLLYDSKAVMEDQLAAVERTSRRTRQRLHRPGAGDRRAALRARAGHHHRRRLPLLRYAQAEIHHRRHPGPHPVHPQHGHRRVDRAVGDRARRRPQRVVGAVPPARLPGLAARRAACRARGQQDGSDRLGPAAFRMDSRRIPRVRGPLGHPRRHHHSDVGAQRRQRGHQVGQGAVVRRTTAADATSRTSTSPATATWSTRASRCST